MPTPVLSESTAHGIRVTSSAVYSPADSDADARNYVFHYTITISNDGESPATLMSRHWIIIDGNGHREDVEGPGVVGKNPRLEPGQSFRYQSFCPLHTPWGTMEGTYRMRRDEGDAFDVEIQRFYLRQP